MALWINLPLDRIEVENLRQFTQEFEPGVFVRTQLARWSTKGFEMSNVGYGWKFNGVFEKGNCFKIFVPTTGLVTGAFEVLEHD